MDLSKNYEFYLPNDDDLAEIEKLKLNFYKIDSLIFEINNNIDTINNENINNNDEILKIINELKEKSNLLNSNIENINNSIIYLTDNVNQNSDYINVIKGDIDEIRRAVDDNSSAINNVHSDIDNVNIELLNLNEKVQNNINNINDLSNKIVNINSNIITLEHKLNNVIQLSEQVELNRIDIINIKDLLTIHDDKIKDNSNDIQEVFRIIEDLNGNAGDIPLNHASTSRIYGVGNDEYYGHVKISNNINNEQPYTGISPKVVKEQLELINNDIKSLLFTVTTNSENIDIIEKSIETLNSNINILNNQVIDIYTNINNISNDVSNNTLELSKLQTELYNLKDNINNIENLVSINSNTIIELKNLINNIEIPTLEHIFINNRTTNIGYNCTGRGISIGNNTRANHYTNVSVGNNINIPSSLGNSTSFGNDNNITSLNGHAYGRQLSCTHNNSMLLGVNPLNSTTSSQIILGSNDQIPMVFNTISTISDERDKTNIDDININFLDFINKVKPKIYNQDFRCNYSKWVEMSVLEYEKLDDYTKKHKTITKKLYEYKNIKFIEDLPKLNFKPALTSVEFIGIENVLNCLNENDSQSFLRAETEKIELGEIKLLKHEFNSDKSYMQQRKTVGFLAQQINEIGDNYDLVFDHKLNGGDDIYSINYQNFIPLLVGAIKQLTDRVIKLEEYIIRGGNND